MSTLKSSSTDLTLNADGVGNDIIFQSNAGQVGSLTAEGVLTATSYAGSGAALTGLAGEVTGSAGANAIADNVVDEANLKISNSPTNGYVLTAQSGNTGGLTWAADSTTDSTKLPLAGGTMTGNIVMADDTSIGISDSDERIEFDGAGDISVLGANLGVGTSSPARSLHINSADANIASFEGHQGEGLVITSGTNGRVDIIGYDDGASSYNALIIRAASGDNGMYFDTSGSVGIGVTPETTHSTVKALQIGMGGRLWSHTSNASRVALSGNAYINSSNADRYINTDEATQYLQEDGTHKLQVTASGAADGAITWTNAVAIDNGGDVTFGASITEKETTKTSSFTPNLTTDGTIFDVSGGITITMPSATAGKSFTIIDAGTGTLAWSGTILWPSGTAPSPSGKTIYSFISNGTNWYGMMAGTGFA